MTHRRLGMALALLVAIMAGAGLVWGHVHGHVQPGLRLYGNVDIRQLALAFRQSGRLTSVAVEEGDRVPAGALVAEIDAAPYR